MKLKSLIRLFLLFSLFFSTSSYSANEFLNSNTACQQIEVVVNSYSVACKNYNSNLNNEVSFTGGIYPDCAVTAYGDEIDAVNTSVLLNKGTGATACTTSGDQFDFAANYTFSGINGSDIIGNVVVGLLNNDIYSDLAIIETDNDRVANAYSQGASGTFSNTTSNVNWQLTSGFISGSNRVERSMALLDCNNDGNLDAAAGILNGFTWEFNVLVNNGAGLQNASLGPYGQTATLITPTRSPSVAVADFNKDGAVDVAMSIGDPSSFTNKIVICLNNKDNVTGKGTCEFTNCLTKNVATDYSAPNPMATSMVAGDFNGDGNPDVAINAPSFTSGNRAIIYYFGDGTGALTSTLSQKITDPNSIPTVLTTGCFNSDNIVDVAVTLSPEGGSVAGVDVLEMNTTQTVTLINLAFNSGTYSAGGIDAADFDRNGRDDIMAARFNSDLFDEISIFMNAVGPGLATAVATIPNQNLIIQTGKPLQLSGICQMSDGSPSDFNYQWSITSPNAANASLTNATTLSPTFTATEFGNYTVQLTCTAVCGSVSNAAVVIVGIPASDQGGCISNSLSPISGPINFSSLLPLLGVVGLSIGRRRKEKGGRLKKLSFFVMILILFGMFGKFAESATSFQTNFFKPVIDDSEYFTVYSSPLMKKGYYHTGFYLDFAQHPYEFGTSQFDRTNGITNHLLTGNFLGSYAIFDWLNAGARVPVYFWNGIRAPLLNRPNENRIDLGDVAIELKFKLVDRKDHKVGWSLLPFFTIPTATHAVRDFTGNGTLTGGVKTMLDGKPHDRVSIALNVGYEARDNVITPGGNRIDDHFLLGFGISGDAIKDKLKVIAETQVETVTKDFFSTRRTTPGEGRLGFRYMFKNGIDLNGGGGLGYTNGIASPDFRVFAGVTYTKRPIAKVAIKEDVGEVAVGDELKLADKIYFDFDKSTIRGMSKPTIDKAAAFIKAHPEIKKLRVEGNTCDLGTVPYNQKLSERRANAVVEYLVEQGVSRSILHPVGYGESRPAVPNTDESHREQNRRVQFFVEEK